MIGEFVSTHPYTEFHLCYEGFMDLAPRGSVENLFDLSDLEIGCSRGIKRGKFSVMPHQRQRQPRIRCIHIGFDIFIQDDCGMILMPSHSSCFREIAHVIWAHRKSVPPEVFPNRRKSLPLLLVLLLEMWIGFPNVMQARHEH